MRDPSAGARSLIGDGMPVHLLSRVRSGLGDPARSPKETYRRPNLREKETLRRPFRLQKVTLFGKTFQFLSFFIRTNEFGSEDAA